MARRPQQSLGNQWAHYIFAPQRFVRILFWGTVLGFIGLTAVRPDLATLALMRVLAALVNATDPFVGPLLALAIAVGAVWFFIIKPILRGGR